MKKILLQFLALAALFAAVFFSLSRVDFTGAADLDRLSQKSSKKLGELMLNSILENSEEIKGGTAPAVLDSIKDKLCAAAGIASDSVQLHLIINSDVNAYALPGNHLVVLTGLVDFSKNPEEVAGVLGHELGHLKLDHIEKKLVKEVGLTMLYTLAGGEGADILRQAVKTITSTAFDRDYETEADDFAVNTMAAAGADPEHLGNFMFRVSQKQDLPEELVFLSTHPESKKRAAGIIKKAHQKTFNPAPLVNISWDSLKAAVNRRILNED